METGIWTYNMDTACVEARCPDGTLIAIDTLAVEREFVETWLDRRELDFLIYNVFHLWLTKGCKESPDELADRLESILEK